MHNDHKHTNHQPPNVGKPAEEVEREPEAREAPSEGFAAVEGFPIGPDAPA